MQGSGQRYRVAVSLLFFFRGGVFQFLVAEQASERASKQASKQARVFGNTGTHHRRVRRRVQQNWLKRLSGMNGDEAPSPSEDAGLASGFHRRRRLMGRV